MLSYSRETALQGAIVFFRLFIGVIEGGLSVSAKFHCRGRPLEPFLHG